jgi:release factor glutamine methyltransferase
VSTALAREPPPAGPTVSDVVAASRRTLQAPASDRRSAWIVADELGVADGDLATSWERVVAPDAIERIRCRVARVAAGEPVQYVLGTWPFRGLDLLVDRRVLIPRPETEVVVGVALNELDGAASSAGRPRSDNARAAEVPVVVDLGTGSGAVALAIATEGPSHVRVWATDASPDALDVAEANRAQLTRRSLGAAGRVIAALGSWYEALPTDVAGHVTMIVSNPPYVSEPEWHALDPEVRDHEPRGALVAGPSGREALDVIVDGALRWLAIDGVLVLELAPDQADQVARRARAVGFAEVEVFQDLAGRPRCLVARRTPRPVPRPPAVPAPPADRTPQ